jgi:hypothetical protein
MKVLITSGMGVIGAEASRKFVKERRLSPTSR